MAPTTLGPHKSFEEAMSWANRAGLELLVWCKASPPAKKKRPPEREVTVHDVPTGLLLSDKVVRGKPIAQKIALALLANRNWRHGGGLALAD